MYKKIITYLILFSIAITMLSCFAYADDYTSSNYTPADIVAGTIADGASELTGFDIPFLGLITDAVSGLISVYGGDGAYCPIGENNLHHTSNNYCYGTGSDEYGTYYLLRCDYCGENFKCYSSDLQDAYDDYVDGLPFSGFDSDGGYYWYPTILDLDLGKSCLVSGNLYYYFNSFPTELNLDYCLESSANIVNNEINLSYSTSRSSAYAFNCFFYLVAPVTGLYTSFDSICYYSSTTNKSSLYDIRNYSSNKDDTFLLSSKVFSVNSTSVSCSFYLPCFKVVPSSSSDSSGTLYSVIYAPSTRINNTSFTLATTENNEITNVYEDVTLIDEGDNILFNPVTNETYNIKNWNYDYTTRTYVGVLDVDPEINFELAYHDDKVVLKIGDVEVELNYVIEQEPEPTPTPEPTPINTPLPVDSDLDTDDTPYWLWLMDWLDNFKAWLGAKLDALLGRDSETIDIDYFDMSDNSTNFYDYSVTYTNEDGEEDDFSMRKLIGKFRWVKDVFDIGKELISVVSSDAAAAYDLNISALDEVIVVDGGTVEVSDNPSGGGDDGSITAEADPVEVSDDAAGAGIMVNNAPYIPVNLGAAQSHYGYDYGGEVGFLDLSWYAPYKQTVDNIVGGFLWLFFAWKLFQKAPGIISGSSMDSSKAEDIERGERRKR